MKKVLICAVILFTLLTTLAVAPAASAQGGDARRRTVAITYFRDPVKVVLAGTRLRPNARGEATVERWRKRNTSEIDITIENMIPAFNYGADYNTYVLWAITPAGQVENLGEFRLSGGSARLKTATAHQSFALVVTAEPHFMSRLPSSKLILENLTPVSNKVQVQATEIFFTGDSGRYYSDNAAPALAERDYNKIPAELLQARKAVQIARLADAERHDPNDYNEAARALARAEEAYRKGANVHEIGRISREAISLAVRARDISEERAIAAERRAEIARRDEELRRANENATDLQSQLSETATRLKASELSRANSDEQLSQALRDGADARAEVRTLQAENDRLREEVERLNQQLTQARSRISTLETQVSSASEKLKEEATRAEGLEREKRERAEAENRRREFGELQAALARIVTVKPVGGGFVAMLPDSFFLPNQASLSLKVKAKMDALGQALAQYSQVIFIIEGHSDSRATADSFALGRAQSVADYIAAYNVPRANFKVESRGATVPLASNKTVRGKAANRRVEIVFSGAP